MNQDNASPNASQVSTCCAPGRRWRLPAEPSTLPKLDTIPITMLTRLLLRSQQRCKEVSSAHTLRQVGRRNDFSGYSAFDWPRTAQAPPHLIHTAPSLHMGLSGLSY